MGSQHDDLTQFIGTIFAGLDGGYAEVRAISASERRRAFFRRTATEGIQRFCDKHADSNCYIGVATRASTKNGKDANLLQLGSIFVDQDPKDVREDEAIGLLERFGFQPSVIVDSGFGMHLYYRLDEPFDLTDANDREQARFLIHAVSDRLHGDKAARDLARILRLPGSLNFKYDLPRPVELLHCDPALICSRKELLAHFHWDDHQREQAAKAKRAAEKTPFRSSEPEVAKIVSALSALDPDAYEGWIAPGMELHHHFQGSEIGFELWDRWSRSSSKYDPAVMPAKWASFSSAGNGSAPRTISSLFKLARDAGWAGYQHRNGSDHSAETASDPTITEAVDHWVWPEPQAIRDEHPAVQAMTPDMLPAPFRLFAIDVAERMSTPIDIVGVALMIATTPLIGRRVQVRPRALDNWTVAPTLWGAVIAPPGVLKKTPSMKQALAPLETLERMKRDRKACEGFDQEVNAARLKALRERINRAAKDGASADEMEELRGDYDEAVAEGSPRRAVINDSTVEALGETFRRNPALLLHRDELAAWIASLEKEGREDARAYFLECWESGGAMRTDRITRGNSVVGDRFLSVLGSYQPEPFTRYLSQTLRAGSDGFIPRFQMLIWPDVGSWKSVDRKPNRDAEEQVYQTFECLWRLRADDVGAQRDPYDSELRFLRFTPEAQAQFDEWYDHLQEEVRGDAHPLFIEHLSKYGSLVPKLSLILHIVENLGSGQPETAISLKNLEFALKWVAYLKSHARRAYYSVIHGAEASAQALASKILKRQLASSFRLREIYRRQWAGLHSREDAEAATELLEDAGWLKRELEERRSMLFKVNPRVYELFAKPNNNLKRAEAA